MSEETTIAYALGWFDETMCDEIIAVMDVLGEAQKDETGPPCEVDGIRWYGSGIYRRTYTILENNVDITHRLLAIGAIEPTFNRFTSKKPWKQLRGDIIDRLMTAAKEHPAPDGFLRRSGFTTSIGIHVGDTVVLTRDVAGVPKGARGSLVKHLRGALWIAEFYWNDPDLEGRKVFKTIDVSLSEVSKVLTP